MPGKARHSLFRTRGEDFSVACNLSLFHPYISVKSKIRRKEPSDVTVRPRRPVRPHPLRLCVHLCGRRGAEDLYQETWVRILEKLPRYQPERPFLPWAAKICVNLYRDNLRRKSCGPFSRWRTAPGRNRTAGLPGRWRLRTRWTACRKSTGLRSSSAAAKTCPKPRRQPSSASASAGSKAGCPGRGSC